MARSGSGVSDMEAPAAGLADRNSSPPPRPGQPPPGPRRAAAVELAKLLPHGVHEPGAIPQICGTALQSAADIAAEAGVSQQTIEDAAKVKKKAPELLPAVKEGKLVAHVAAQVADLPEAERKEVVAKRPPAAARLPAGGPRAWA